MKKNVLAMLFLVVSPYAYSGDDNGSGGEPSKAGQSCVMSTADKADLRFNKNQNSHAVKACTDKIFLKKLMALIRVKADLK
ncbi:MAG: hypothetical protein L3J52_07440 [Proteobacteria bacterium]|nr:hypothetical protein [Pseudomonadota bacterium]